MKSIQISAAVLAITFAALVPAGADKVLDTFKKDLEGLKALKDEKKAEIQKKPQPTMADKVLTMRAMGAKLTSFKPEGLPEDLKAAFVEYVTGVAKMLQLLKPFPETAAEIDAFVEKKQKEEPQFMPDLMTKMKAAAATMQPLARNLSETARKHGVDASEALK